MVAQEKNSNQLNIRAESFDAFVEFQFGVTPTLWRLKSIQQVETEYDFQDEDRYADDGSIFLVRTAMVHSFSIPLILTADEFDTNLAPSAPDDTHPLTMSYLMQQKYLGNRVQINMVQVFLTKGDNTVPNTTPFLRHAYIGDVQRFGMIRPVGDAVELPTYGRIVNPVGTPPVLQRQVSYP